MQIRSFEDVNHILESYYPSVTKIESPYNLERMTAILNMLGNPQDKVKVIHVAGTSGKTSTSYYIASLLRTASQKVGLSVSPHVEEVSERLQINVKPLPEAEYCRVFSEFLDVLKQTKVVPTYFELLVVFAFWYFDLQRVDYAVMEVGLGGLLDATNVVNRADKVCAITDIGLDHTNVLGNSLPEIAAQKAGIIQQRNVCMMHVQSEPVMRPVRDRARAKDAKLVEIPDNKPAGTSLPLYQARNWHLANQVYNYLVERDSLPVLDARQLLTAQQVRIPGRMETFTMSGQTVILDGAHNQQKFQALIGSFIKLYPHKKAAVLLAIKQGKDHLEIAPLLKTITAATIVTSFDSVQDTPVRSMEPDVLAQALKAAGCPNVEVIPDTVQAFRTLLTKHSDVCLVTGSFFLISTLKRLAVVPRPEVLKNY